MKKTILCVLVAVLTTACFTKKNVVEQRYSLPNNVSYSDGFKAFVDELSMESVGIDSLENYVPSNMMKSKFNISENNGGVYEVKGFIQVIPMMFDAYQFEQLGGYLTFFADGIYQYRMPISNLRKMLDVKGLVQVDVERHRKDTKIAPSQE